MREKGSQEHKNHPLEISETASPSGLPISPVASVGNAGRVITEGGGSGRAKFRPPLLLSQDSVICITQGWLLSLAYLTGLLVVVRMGCWRENGGREETMSECHSYAQLLRLGVWGGC